jgi:type IV secretory pathway VirJ component
MISLWLFVFFLALLAGCNGPLPVRLLKSGRYGSVKLVKPAGTSDAFIILFSDRMGLTAADGMAAQTLAKRGASVLEVDSRAYLERLDNVKEPCSDLVLDAEGASHALQREYHFPNYLAPILAGTGVGGTLAEVTLASAPQVTIAGAVSIDPSPTFGKAICSNTAGSANGFSYSPSTKLPGFWTVGLTANAPLAARKHATALQEAGISLELRTLRPGASLGDELWVLIEPHISAEIDVAELPLTILPVAKPSRLMAVVISGDGGWRDLDRTIAEYLQKHGVPVVGWDSLRYFWREKTPEETSHQLAAILTAYMARWHAPDVALIGFSFGADVMPFAYDGLSSDLRSHIKLIALLGLAHSADFRIVILGPSPSSTARPLVAELDKIPADLLQCYYGHDEADTACPTQVGRGAQVIERPGGHHFDGNYDLLAADILKGFRARAAEVQVPVPQPADRSAKAEGMRAGYSPAASSPAGTPFFGNKTINGSAKRNSQNNKRKVSL